MRVFRSINNNIVSTLDEQDREVVVIGRGIGFKAQFGTEIPPSKIDKALNPWMIIPIGLVFAVIYYFVFRFAIQTFKLKTPGNEDEDLEAEAATVTLANNDFTAVARTVLEGLCGKDNVTSFENCITRLRVEGCFVYRFVLSPESFSNPLPLLR